MLLVVVVLVLVGPVVGPRDAQAASREALTAAIVDHHTVRLDAERGLLSVDYAVRRGHLYSDKAPLQPVLAVPFYALYRVFARPPSPRGAENDLALWWMTVWTVTVPAAAVAVTMRRVVARRGYAGGPASLSIAIGTTVLPLSGMLFGHVLAGALLFGSWAAVTRPRHLTWELPAGGLLCGAAVATEYPIAAAAVLLAGYVAWTTRTRSWRFVAGAVPPGVLLLVYQSAAFGSPWRPSYRSSAFARHQRGLVGIEPPNVHELWRALLGDRGLLLITPIVVVAVISALLQIRRRHERADATLALALLAVFLVFQAGVDAYGGASPGPRFVVPVLPFLAVPLAVAWHRRPLLCAGATLCGAAIMLLALWTNPYPVLHTDALSVWLSFARDGYWTHTIFSLHHRSGWPLLAMVGTALVPAAQILRAEPVTAPAREAPS